jgi:hypothetical protein
MGIISSAASNHTASEVLKLICDSREMGDDEEQILEKVEEKLEQIQESARLGYE